VVASPFLYCRSEFKDIAEKLSRAMRRQAQSPLSSPHGLPEIGVVDKGGDVGLGDCVVGAESDMP
jgi:hypothetical protein